MEINLMILRKNSSEKFIVNYVKEIINILSELFVEVTNENIIIKYNEKLYSIGYKISSNDDKLLYLKLEYKDTPMKTAKILDEALRVILKGQHRNEYNIIVVYNEVSHLYCCKLMPLFGIYERRLRELVYLTIVKMFGVSWYKKSFNKELKDVLENKPNQNVTSLIEGALDELTYEQMKQYLFEPMYINDPEELITNLLKDDSLERLEKSELILKLRSCEKKSLWERFFDSYVEFDNLLEEINCLQKTRNIVMHHKKIDHSQYEQTRKLLRTINGKLENAINVLENKIYTEENYVDVYHSYENVLKSVDKIKPETFITIAILLRAALSTSISSNINFSSMTKALEIFDEKLNVIKKERKPHCSDDIMIVLDNIQNSDSAEKIETILIERHNNR